MGHLWRGLRIPFGVDNMAFEASAAKGRSRVARLNELVRELFALQVQFGFVFDFFWLSSEDNLLADHLSRDRELQFLTDVFVTGFFEKSVVPLRSHDAGRVRVLPEKRGELHVASFRTAASAPLSSVSEFSRIEGCSSSDLRPSTLAELQLGPEAAGSPDGDAASHASRRHGNGGR